HTESSHRFERGVAPNRQVLAMERATDLVLQICGGAAGPVVLDSHTAHLPKRAVIGLRKKRLKKVLGKKFDKDEIIKLFNGLGCVVEEVSIGWAVTPPAWRFDLNIEEDLIEEVARISGYSEIPSTPETPSLRFLTKPDNELSLSRLRDLFVDRGYNEAVTYSFIDKALHEQLFSGAECLPLSNPLSEQLAVMRTSLWPGLLNTLNDNLRHQQPVSRLFEIGMTFVSNNGALKQSHRLGLLRYGSRVDAQWGADATPSDFYDLKRDLESVCERNHSHSGLRFEAAEHIALHPGQSARIVLNDQPIGWIGALHPAIAQQLGLDQSVLLAEIAVDNLAQGLVPSYETFSKFPVARRDIAMIVDDEIPANAVKSTAVDAIKGHLGKKSDQNWVIDAQIFDIYTGAGIDSGRKSIALGLILQHKSRTLTDEEADTAVANAIAALEKEFKAQLR
ncbi:MAG: phenylalanine--tRNA ligase subunit beta, partial [Gammaproteobacteria bacterium]|nr:phenylalanine--tRNA ligase subunit beta [Gammaproteobacteria bacterium]